MNLPLIQFTMRKAIRDHGLAAVVAAMPEPMLTFIDLLGRGWSWDGAMLEAESMEDGDHGI